MGDLTASEKAEKAKRLFELEDLIKNTTEQIKSSRQCLEEHRDLAAELSPLIRAKPGPVAKPEPKARKPRSDKGQPKAKKQVDVVPGEEFDLK